LRLIAVLIFFMLYSVTFGESKTVKCCHSQQIMQGNDQWTFKGKNKTDRTEASKLAEYIWNTVYQLDEALRSRVYTAECLQGKTIAIRNSKPNSSKAMVLVARAVISRPHFVSHAESQGKMLASRLGAGSAAGAAEWRSIFHLLTGSPYSYWLPGYMAEEFRLPIKKTMRYAARFASCPGLKNFKKL